MPYLPKKNGLKVRPVPGWIPFSLNTPQPTTRLEPPVRLERPERRDARLWPWVLAAVVGVWMFGLGVVAGRYMTPVEAGEDIHAELERLRTEEVRADRKRMEAVGEEIASASFEFYDALVDGDPDVPPPPPVRATERAEGTGDSAGLSSETPVRPPEIKRALAKKPQTASAPDTEAAVSPPARRVSPAAPKPVPDPESVPAPSRTSRGAYAVQVASFAVREDADRLTGVLRDNGYDGVFVADEPGTDGVVRYRVKVGHFRTYADAQVVLDRLKSRERIHDAFVARPR